MTNAGPRIGPKSAEQMAAILGDMRTLMAAPERVEGMLAARGYTVRALAGGFLALPATTRPEVLLLAPLHKAAAMVCSGFFVTGEAVARCGTIVAALQAATPSTALLFASHPIANPAGDLPGCAVLSLEGGVTPRIWPGCFGSVDLLVRCIGRLPHPAAPNKAVNAVEGAIPILSALHAASMVRLARRRGSGSPDAPLTPRLSVVAAHGGARGVSPTLFDIVLNRRYSPRETVEGVTAEIDALVRGAAVANLRVELSVMGNTSPVEDPTRRTWSREAAALNRGWGWPQTPFRTSPPLVANSILFGGLDSPGLEKVSVEAGDAVESVSLEEVAALALSLTSYLAEPSLAEPGDPGWTS